MHRACLALPNSFVFSLKIIQTWWSFRKVLIFPFLLLSVEKNILFILRFFCILSFLFSVFFFFRTRAPQTEKWYICENIKIFVCYLRKWPTTISNGLFCVISEKTVINMTNYYFDTYSTICFFIYSKSIVFCATTPNSNVWVIFLQRKNVWKRQK